MTDAKGVVRTFGSFWKSADALVYPVGIENIPSFGKDLVSIGLMAHIPDKLVVGRIENVMQCHGQFHHPQAGAEVPAVHRDNVYYILPEFLTQFRKIGFLYF